MSVWMVPLDPMSALSLRLNDATAFASTTATASCDEVALVADARALLSSRFDVEMGAVLPGTPAQVGFQYVKIADALLAAQAIAHDDFSRAASQFRRVLSHQEPSGALPLIVYGPSVDRESRWIQSDLTFFPGPAFWHPNVTVLRDDAVLPTSSVAAPPIAADVAWQMYRLSPYETAMGVVGHSTEAVAFLCDVYAPLRKLHAHLITSRRDSNDTALLTVQHPWETFSPFSAHWKKPLAEVKMLPGYDAFVAQIPATAKARFVKGALLEGDQNTSVTDFYEPMMFLGSCLGEASAPSSGCVLSVHDVEFNALVLRSASALVDIGRVLLERSSACPNFDLGWKELQSDVEVVRAQAMALRDAIVGNDSAPSRLWNSTAQFFTDDDRDPASTPSLRDLLPAFAVHLPEQQLMGILSHFLPSSDTFQFLCSHFPTAFFPCGSVPVEDAVTLLPYNYFLQRALAMNEFAGLGTYVRNMTRDMVCTSLNSTDANATDSVALAFQSDSAQPIAFFQDGFAGSSLAAALLLNILLPAVTSPPSPDTPPVDHRMLTVMMCVELVVAFGVALSCVFLSVYFVANRPREKRPVRSSTAETRRSKRNTREPGSERSDSLSGGLSSSVADSQSSFGSSVDLEEGLLSEEEDQAYGSFNRQRAAPGASSPGGTWQVVKEALASISPW